MSTYHFHEKLYI